MTCFAPKYRPLADAPSHSGQNGGIRNVLRPFWPEWRGNMHMPAGALSWFFFGHAKKNKNLPMVAKA